MGAEHACDFVKRTDRFLGHKGRCSRRLEKIKLLGMGLVLLFLFGCLCFVLPPVLCQKGRVSRLTVGFWWFFGVTAIINAFAHHALYGTSEFDKWTRFIGPALV